MAFPASLSEFVDLSAYTLKIYKRCRDSPGEYKALAPQVRQLANVLQDLDDLASSEKFDSSRQPELLENGQVCNEVLSDLEVLLQNYSHLPTQSKRAWDRLNWDEQGLRDIKDRLLSATACVSAFYDDVTNSDKLQVEGALEQLVRDYQGGHREASSVFSMTTTGSEDEDSSWFQVCKDLEDLGVSDVVANEYRSFISDWFVRAIKDGLLQEKVLEDKNFLSPLPASRRSSRYRPSSESMRSQDLSPPALSPPTRSPPPIPSPMSQSSSQPNEIPPSIPSIPSPYIPSPSPRQPSPPQRSPAQENPRPRPPIPSPPTQALAELQIPAIDPDDDTMKFVVASPPPSLPPPRPPKLRNEEDGMKVFVRRKPLSDEPLPHQGDLIAFPRGSDQEPPIPVPPDNELPMAIHGLDEPIPLAYEDTSTNLIWTAQKIVRHWTAREWEKADKQLIQQLEDVQKGVTIEMKGIKRAPEPRLLLFLLGVSASFQGKYQRAKQWFDMVMQGPYDPARILDEGDLAAARWLGDTCLLLNEPHNAALAYSIAMEGLTQNFGLTPERERMLRGTTSDLRDVQYKMGGLTKLQEAFNRHDDVSTIYAGTSPVTKARLVHETLTQARYRMVVPGQVKRAVQRIDVDEGFLIQPLIAYNKWPLQWDPYFSAEETVQILTTLDPAKGSTWPRTQPFSGSINVSSIPTISLGQSSSLIFATKRDPTWLVESVRNFLLTQEIEFKERSESFVCRLEQQLQRISYFETLVIKIRRLPMRKTYGIKVTSSRTCSRNIRFGVHDASRVEFAEIVKAALEAAEAETNRGRPQSIYG